MRVASAMLALVLSASWSAEAGAQDVLRDLAHIVATGGVAGELAIPVCQTINLEHGELARRGLLQDAQGAIRLDTGGLLARYGVARFAAEHDVGALVELVRGLGYHALAFGESDLGDPRALVLARARALREVGVPYLATNLRCSEGAAEVCDALMTGNEGVPMMQRGESRVALLGYLEPSALTRVGPDRARGLRIEPLTESIRNGVRAAHAAQADVVIAIVDTGYGADAIARVMEATQPLDAADKPDVVLVAGAGTQLVFARPASFRPAIAAAPTRSASNIHVRHNGQSFDILVRPSDDAEEVHPAFERFIERLGPAYCQALGQDLPGGRLDPERDAIDAGQLGTLVADVMRDASIADVAVLNHSAIDERWSLRGSQALTESDINIGVQYDEPLMAATVPATWLRDLARAQNSRLMTRGLNINNAFESSEKIKVNGRLLDLEANYRVVTIRFLAEGGDHRTLPAGVEWQQMEGLTLRSVMRDYLRTERSEDPREVPDPADRLEWTFRINTDATFAGSAVRDPGGYAEGPLQNANQVQLGLNATVGLNALSRRAAWENLITGTITGAATSESNGFDEGADQILYRTSGNYRGFRADNDEIYVPDLVLEGLLRTEFTKQAERDQHFLNMRFTTGLQWRLHLKVKVKLLGGFEVLEAADDDLRSVEPGLGGQLIIDPWTLMREGLRKLTLGTTVDYFTSGLGNRNRHLIQGTFDLQLNVNRYFALALNVSLYGLKKADNDFSFAMQTTAGVRIGWVARRVQR